MWLSRAWWIAVYEQSHVLQMLRVNRRFLRVIPPRMVFHVQDVPPRTTGIAYFRPPPTRVVLFPVEFRLQPGNLFPNPSELRRNAFPREEHLSRKDTVTTYERTYFVPPATLFRTAIFPVHKVFIQVQHFFLPSRRKTQIIRGCLR